MRLFDELTVRLKLSNEDWDLLSEDQMEDIVDAIDDLCLEDVIKDVVTQVIGTRSACKQLIVEVRR